MTAGQQLAELIAQVPLVDHHVHGALRESPTRGGFESMINEGLPGEPPASMSPFDSQLGFAIRRHCGPLLGVEPSAPADAYWQARGSFAEAEVNSRLLPAAGVSDWIIDTGFAADMVLSVDELAHSAGGRGHGSSVSKPWPRPWHRLFPAAGATQTRFARVWRPRSPTGARSG